jgi:hypothetical protein
MLNFLGYVTASRQNHDIKIGNRCFENVAQLRYLGTTITNENLIQEEINRRLNSGNACYHSVQNFLSSRLRSKNIKVRIYKIVILSAILYGCATFCLTLRDTHRLRLFENRMLRRMCGAKRDEETGGWRKLHNQELHNFYSSTGIIRMIKSRKMRWAGHVTRIGEKRIACIILVGKPEGRRPLEKPRRRCWTILKWILDR